MRINDNKNSNGTEDINSLMVKKANSLIDSIGKISLMSEKVMLAALLNVQERNGAPESEAKYYQTLLNDTGVDYSIGLVAELTNSELRRMMDSKSGSYYTTIKKLMDPKHPDSLKQQWGIMIKKPETGRYGYTEILSACIYDSNNGRMFIKFSSEVGVKKQVFNLKENYTLLPYSTMMKFENKYSYRLYELLMSKIGFNDSVMKKKQNTYTFNFGLSELKFLLGVFDPVLTQDSKDLFMKEGMSYEEIENSFEDKKKMTRWSDIKKLILEKAKDELDKVSDFNFDYEPIRNGTGGKVVGVELTMTRKQKVIFKDEIVNDSKDDVTKKNPDDISETDKLTFLEKIYQEYSSLGFSLVDIKAISETAYFDEERVHHAMELFMKAKNVNNAVGWVISAIQHNYPESKTYSAKTDWASKPWNQFMQRKYTKEDIDELERRKLGVYSENKMSEEEMLRQAGRLL